MPAPLTTPVWGDPGDAERPGPLREAVAADVCVVGLGGSGLAAVGAALEAGASVIGLDAGPIAGGAAGRNGGFLLAGAARFHHDAVAAWGEERAVGIYQESLRELDRLEAELGDPIVRRVGSLRIPASPEEEQDCADQLAMLRRHGLPAEPADGPTGRGVFIPGDGSVQPLERCRLLARRAVAAGARLYCDSPAVAVAGTNVRTAEGEVTCRAVVACVDGGIEALFGELAGRARTARLQMLATAPVEPGRIPCPVYDNWGYDYWQQLPDGRIALGGGRSVHAGAEWEGPAEPGDEVQAYLDALLRERLGVDAPVTHRWAGRIAYTDDRLPVFTELRPGVMVAGAHSGHGNVLGSAAGRAAMAVALGRPAGRLAELLA
ncbi:MAG TPA: FAD-dependent oxidoreductase [Solirubrobacteraceae bacterium]|jgi:glycine/D-amino acid oxidase-like deaminating enzyme|nr:FAD-dependent oxidoreductase [Solirubrobacteraceae bacterium]